MTQNTDYDITDVEYPDHPNDLPRDAGETFDLVVRKGPISLDGLMDQIFSMAEDDVYTHLSALREAGYLTSRDGDIHKDGTTATVWEVSKGKIND